MEVTVPLFVISIALFLLALGALADDRHAWACRFAAAADPPSQAPPCRELEISSLMLDGPTPAGTTSRNPGSQPARGALPPPIPPHARRRRSEHTAETMLLPARGRARPAGSSRWRSQPLAEGTTDEITIVKAQASVSRPPVMVGAPVFVAPPAPPGASLRAARGTPPLVRRQPAVPCWPIGQLLPPPFRDPARRKIRT
jgi:hypothetical protein